MSQEGGNEVVIKNGHPEGHASTTSRATEITVAPHRPAREVLAEMAGDRKHFPNADNQSHLEHQQPRERHHGERIRVGEHLLSEEESLIVEHGTQFYIDDIKSRLAQAEQALLDAEMRDNAEGHASNLATKGIEWLHQLSGQELSDEILASPDIRQAYERVAYLKGLIGRVRDGDSDALREVKDFVPKTSRFAKAATKQAQIEQSLYEQLATAQEQALALSGDKPLDESGTENSGDSIVTAFAQELMETISVDDILNVATVGRLVRLAAIDKLDYDLLRQRLQVALQQKIKESANSELDVDKQVAHLLNGIYGDPTLAGSQARQQMRDKGLDTKLLVVYESLVKAAKQDGDWWRNKILSQLQEKERMSDEALKRASLPGDTVIEHYTPISVEIIRNGGLRPKEEHGRSVVNDGETSNLPHFTSMAEVFPVGSIDYRKYALQKLPPFIDQLRNDSTLEHLPGVFTISLADVVKSGKNCVLASIKEANGTDVPEDIVFAEQDGSPARFGLDSMQFTALRNLESNPDFSQKYEKKLKGKMEQLRETWDKKQPWQEYVAANYHPKEILREHLIADGVDPSWVEQHVVGSIGEARERSRIGSEGSVVVPLARARNTKFPEESVDSNGTNHLRLPLIYMGVAEAA